MKSAFHHRVAIAGLLVVLCGVGAHSGALEPAGAEASGRGGPYHVTSLDDPGEAGDGLITLREALDAANAAGVPVTITFDAALAGGTIQPLTWMPQITGGSITIIGDIDDDDWPDIEIDGSISEDSQGLQLSSSNNTIDGLIINGFAYNGIVFWGPDANDNTISHCFIGTDSTGTQAQPNGHTGIWMYSNVANNEIGPGNVISGNSSHGIIMEDGPSGNVIHHTHVGVDVTGMARLANAGVGIWVKNNVTNCTIGPGNVLSGNDAEGLALTDGVTNSTVYDNIIGLSADGTTDIGNNYSGITVRQDCSDITIGPGNVVSGNGNESYWSIGISVYAAGTINNKIIGNLIGTDGTGMIAIPNTSEGIRFGNGASYNEIGGPLPEDRNVVSGNGGTGILIGGGTCDGNQVQNNLVGLNADQTALLGNGSDGIFVYNLAANNLIGPNNIVGGTRYNHVVLSGEGTTGNTIFGNVLGVDLPGGYEGDDGVEIRGYASGNTVGPDNVITGNTYNGIEIRQYGTDHNTVTQNTITGNGELGIELWGAANEEIEPPTITWVTADTITGTAAVPDGSTIEFFVDAEDEGNDYFGSTTVLGEAFEYTGSIPQMGNITAAVTDTSGNTSELAMYRHGLAALAITGPSCIGGGDTVYFDCTAEFHQGPDQSVTTAANWTVEPAEWATFVAPGLLETYAVPENVFLTVRAEWGGEYGHTAELTVVLYDLPGADCNDNGVIDACDLVDGGGVTLFAAGMYSPEDMVALSGAYPDGIYVTEAEWNMIIRVAPDGSDVSIFATDIPHPLGATAVPDSFGGLGDRMMVAAGSTEEGPQGIYAVNSDGTVEMFAPISGPAAQGVAYVPTSIGGPAAGKLLATGPNVGATYSLLYLVDETGTVEVIASFPKRVFTLTMAPADFGSYDHHVFAVTSDEPDSDLAIYAFDLHTYECEVFAYVGTSLEYRGLRQVAFSPTNWAADLDPTVANERVLLVSMASANEPTVLGGSVLIYDENARRVGHLTSGVSNYLMNPRGFYFAGDDVLIADIGEAHGWIARASISDFAVYDCDADWFLDPCEIAIGAADCNENGIPDACEIADGWSEDDNGDGIPDECGVECGYDQEPTRLLLVSSEDSDSVEVYKAYTGELVRTIADASSGLDAPDGLAVDDEGDLYVASADTNSVLKVSLVSGEPLMQFSGGALATPSGLLLGEVTLLVSSAGNNSVKEYNLETGLWMRNFVAAGSGGLNGPAGLLRAPDGNVLVASRQGNQVLEYEAQSGAFVRVLAQGAELAAPTGLLFDSSGNLLVANSGGDNVLKYRPDGAYLGEFVSAGSGGLSVPVGLCWSPGGSLLVAGHDNNRVLEYDGTDGSLIGAFASENMATPNCALVTTMCDADCNDNQVLDRWDIDLGTSADCQPNGVPDECDLVTPPDEAAPQDVCAAAELACTNITYYGTTVGATNDGSTSCGSSSTTPDVWYYYRPVGNGYLTVSLCGSSYDTVLSIHTGCPGTPSNEAACNDDLCGEASLLNVLVLSGHDYWIRVSGSEGATGDYQMTLSGPACEFEHDCNENGVPDECDIADGTCTDLNGNRIPDQCEQVGDMNCDGYLNAFDIDPFVLALTTPSQYVTQYPDCDWTNADVNGDGFVDAFDIDPFIVLLTHR